MRYRSFVFAALLTFSALLSPAFAQSGDYRIDALLVEGATVEGTPANPGLSVTFSFYKPDSPAHGLQLCNADIGEVSSATQNVFRSIFNQFTMFHARIYFSEVQEPANVGTIRIFTSNNCAGTYAVGKIPSVSKPGPSWDSDIILDPDYDNANTTNGFATGFGSSGYRALWHEIGHAIGFRHPVALIDTGEYFSAFTVMSLNYVNNYWQASPTTPRQTGFRAIDKLALQYVYGCPIWGCGTYDPYAGYEGPPIP